MTAEPSLEGDRGLWRISLLMEHQEETPDVPAVTRWEVLVEPSYPEGGLVFVPASPGGMTVTFPHQMANDFRKGKPYRTGNPCLTQEGSALQFLGSSTEPDTAYHRLYWHVERLSEWIHRARAGTLLQPGDYFEHPDPRATAALTLAYHETSDELNLWQRYTHRHGTVECRGLKAKQMTLYPVQFNHEGAVVQEIRWGQRIQNADIQVSGLWVMLKDIPLIPPWGYPRTWGELRSALHEQSLDLDAVLREQVESLRDGNPHPLLLGYPIPNLVAGPAVRIHWQGLLLPRLTQKLTARGFRPSPEGRWRYDRGHSLTDHQPLTVYESANHHATELGSRGLRPVQQQVLRMVVIGAGALGAPLAEHLVRTGVQQITIIDDDVVKHGNLVRHPATLEDIGLRKAEALANRLNSISPHVQSVGLTARFPSHTHQQALEEADVIVDTTGSDAVIRLLASQRFTQKPVMVSVSLGWQARTLYAYAQQAIRFSADDFFDAVLPHVGTDRPEDHLQHTPREGIGCWHPVFPATYTDVQLMVSCAAVFIEEVLSMERPEGFRVYEQHRSDDGRWSGVRVRP